MTRFFRTTLLVSFLYLSLLSCSRVVYDSDGYARVMKDGKYGLLDEQKRQVLPFEFDSISLFTDGYSIVSKDGRFGVVNTSGRGVIPCSYRAIYYDGGVFVAEKASKELVLITKSKGYLAESNEEYSTIVRFGSDSLTCAAQRGKYGIINKRGETVIPFLSETPFKFDKNGHACIMQKGKYGVIDKDLHIIVPMEYENDGIHFSGGIAYVKKNGKYGALELKGNVLNAIVPCVHANISSISIMIQNRWLWGEWLLKDNMCDAYYVFDPDGICYWVYRFNYPIPMASGRYAYKIEGNTINLYTDDDVIKFYKKTDSEMLVDSGMDGKRVKAVVRKIRNLNQ